MLGIIPKALKPLGYLHGLQIIEELIVSSMLERIYVMLNYGDTFTFLLKDLATIEALIKFAS